MPLQRVIELATETTLTKFPVYEDSLDQIIGMVHIKDLLSAVQSPECQGCTASQYMREPLFAPETLPVSQLLRLFRDNRQHIAIVLDEFGGTAGLATLEDLMEKIVGEVNDPFDEDNPGFQTLPDGSVLIDGLTLIDEVNEQLKLSLADDYYDTLGGYVMGRLGRIPRLNDSIEIDGLRIRVTEMDGMRVARVAITRPAPPAAAAEPAGAVRP